MPNDELSAVLICDHLGESCALLHGLSAQCGHASPALSGLGALDWLVPWCRCQGWGSVGETAFVVVLVPNGRHVQTGSTVVVGPLCVHKRHGKDFGEQMGLSAISPQNCREATDEYFSNVHSCDDRCGDVRL